MQLANANLEIEFTVSLHHFDQLMLDADLLVAPSTWSEAFGLVVLEAGLRGLSAPTFAVGGIPEWLSDGVDGRLAPAEAPTAAALARAVVECVRDPAELARLGNKARERARRFDLDARVDALLAIFEGVTGVDAAAPARIS